MPDAPDDVAHATPRLAVGALLDVCAAAGAPAPDVTQPFDCFVLGGDPALATAIAAEHPHATVWAWDPHPEHREALRRAHDRSGLDNLVVHEGRSLPGGLDASVDIALLDEVLDTASDDQRSEMWRFVGDSLRPGGLLSVSYRTVIGWSEVQPLIHLMRYVARGHRGAPAARAPYVLDLVRRLRDGGAAYLTKRPRVAAWVDALLTTDHATVERDLLRHDIRPLSHAQVAALAAAIGCTHLGLVEDAEHDMPDDLVAAVDAASTVVLRQTYADLAVRRTHRTDVFRFGMA